MKTTVLISTIAIVSILIFASCSPKTTKNTGTVKKPQSQQNSSSSNSMSNATSSNIQVNTKDGEMLVLNPNRVEIPKDKNSWIVGNTVYSKDFRHGILDRNGKIIALLPANISYAKMHSEGLIPFKDKTSGKWGFCNTNGEILIKPQFDSAEPFKNGLAAVKPSGNSKIGFINKQGQIVIQAAYSYVFPFFNSKYAFVKFSEDKDFSIIDNTGKIISKNIWTRKEVALAENKTSPNPWLTNQVFNHQLIVSKKGEKFGYKNLNGDWAIEPKYSYASQFRHGVATIGIKTGNHDYYGLIDKTGKTILEAEYISLSTAWSNSFESEANVTVAGVHKSKGAAIFAADGKIIYGFTKQINGKNISTIHPYKYDLAMVELNYKGNKSEHFSLDSRLSTFIDRSGNIIFQPKDWYLSNFNKNGLAFFTNYDPQVLGVFNINPTTTTDPDKTHIRRSGFINKKGEIVIKMDKQASQGYFPGLYRPNADDSKLYEPTFKYLQDNNEGNDGIYISYFGKNLTQKPDMGAMDDPKGDFSTNYMRYSKKVSGKTVYGYINLETGNPLKLHNLDSALPFNDGYSIIKPGGYVVTKQ